MHPFLLAVFSILFLYSENMKELYFDQLLIPLLLALMVIALVRLLTGLAVRQRHKAAVITTIFGIIFFSYGHVYGILKLLVPEIESTVFRHLIFIPLMMTLWLLAGFLIGRSRRDYGPVSKILNVIILFLVLFNGIKIGGGWLNQKGYRFPPGGEISSQISTGSLEEITRPDIYFIILDGFASERTIRDFFRYRDRRFFDFLEQMGFHVFKDSRTEFNNTLQSMATRLNFRKIREDEDPVQLIRYAGIVPVLKKLDYDIYHFPFDMNISMHGADKVLGNISGDDRFFFDSFFITALNTTMFRFLGDRFEKSSTLSRIHRNRIMYIFEKLKRMVKKPGPKFVYAHILSPHIPFVFGAAGEEIHPDNHLNIKGKSFYLGQYIYIAAQTEKLVKEIVRKSQYPPVIVIQSDHGPRGIRPRAKRSRISDDWILDMGEHEWLILNAFRLPDIGGGSRQWPETLRPVDTFPFLMKSLFNFNMPVTEAEPGAR